MNGFFDYDIDKAISQFSGSSNTDTLKKELNNYLFSKYCEKGYLCECEPEYCAHRYNGSCKYINALHEIIEKYGIDLRG